MCAFPNHVQQLNLPQVRLKLSPLSFGTRKKNLPFWIKLKVTSSSDPEPSLLLFCYSLRLLEDFP